jgi:hypothetical protein
VGSSVASGSAEATSNGVALEVGDAGWLGTGETGAELQAASKQAHRQMRRTRVEVISNLKFNV